MDQPLDRFGMGMVSRDSDGRIVVARAVSRNGCVDSMVGEALTSFQAVNFFKELGLSSIILEGDHAQIIVKGLTLLIRIGARLVI